MFNYYRYKNLLKRILIRLFHAFLTVIVVSFIVFFAMHFAPGRPAELILGQDVTPEGIERIEKELGLDLPLSLQYFNFLKGIFTGNFGLSFRSKRPVIEEISRTFPISLQLASIAVGICSVIGVFIGIISAVKRGSILDDVVRIGVLAGVSVPVFWLGLLLMYLFAIRLKIFPATGWGTFKQMILPCLTLAIFPLALFVRFTRSSMLEVINQDYIRTALAKGLPYKEVIYRHALKNALIPVITVIGLQYATLIAGSIMIEQVFNIPGLGNLLLTGVYSRDYPIVRTCILLVSIFFISINLIIDFLYSIIDPRVSI